MAAESESGSRRGSPLVPYDVAKQEFTTQLAQIDGLDAKLANTFGFGSALIVVAAAFLGLKNTDVSTAMVAILSVSGATYLVLAMFSLVGYRIKDWDFGPMFNAVCDLATKEDDFNVSWAVAKEIDKAYQTNKPHVEKKALWVGRTLWLLAAETILLTAGLLTSFT